MLSSKLRRKLLLKWAQTPGSPPSPSSPASPASPASPGSPTSPTAPSTPDSTTSITGKGPSQPASSMMNIGTGWPNWIQQINALVSTVDKVILAGTKQKWNFNDLFQQKFPSGVDTSYPPPDPTGDVIRFGRQIFQQIMNNSNPYTRTLTGAEMRSRIGTLLQSPYLVKFQQINPAGPLGASGAQLSTLRAALQAFYNSLPQS